MSKPADNMTGTLKTVKRLHNFIKSLHMNISKVGIPSLNLFPTAKTGNKVPPVINSVILHLMGHVCCYQNIQMCVILHDTMTIAL